MLWLHGGPPSAMWLTSQQAQNICITFVQRRPNVQHCTNVIQMFCVAGLGYMMPAFLAWNQNAMALWSHTSYCCDREKSHNVHLSHKRPRSDPALLRFYPQNSTSYQTMVYRAAYYFFYRRHSWYFTSNLVKYRESGNCTSVRYFAKF